MENLKLHTWLASYVYWTVLFWLTKFSTKNNNSNKYLIFLLILCFDVRKSQFWQEDLAEGSISYILGLNCVLNLCSDEWQERTNRDAWYWAWGTFLPSFIQAENCSVCAEWLNECTKYIHVFQVKWMVV